MTNEMLRDLTIEHGPDSSAWGENGRRHAVTEALENDETQKAPDLMSDAVTAAVSGAKFRNAVIEALGHQQSAMRLAALGLALERALTSYVLEQLEEKAEEFEGEWLAADQRERAREDAESRWDAAREA